MHQGGAWLRYYDVLSLPSAGVEGYPELGYRAPQTRTRMLVGLQHIALVDNHFNSARSTRSRFECPQLQITALAAQTIQAIEF